MNEEELFRRLAVALAIGLLIGLERGWQTRQEADHQRTAGLRTFALTGLLGGVCGLLSLASSPLVLAAALVVYGAALIAFSLLEATAEKNFSVTSVAAGILTFVLGAYATLATETVAVAAAVTMAILLALREPLHSWVRNVSWAEMRSVLVLLAMSFLLLPILPNHNVDPWNVLNPAEIWLLAILIAALSFGGYVAVRLLGDRRGVALTALAGGLTSSTATTVSFARLAREHPENWRLLSAGILLAGVTMLVRVVLLSGVLKPELLAHILLPCFAAAAVMLIASAKLFADDWQSKVEAPKLEINNPFDIVLVLQLAAIIAVVMVLANLLAKQTGSAGVFVLAGISAIADVDALALSMARLAGDDLSLGEAGAAILIAAGTNTLSKSVIAFAIGGERVGTVVGGVSVAAIVVLAAACLVLRWL